MAFKVFKPEPGKRKSFYFAIQFKRASFSDCSISTSREVDMSKTESITNRDENV